MRCALQDNKLRILHISDVHFSTIDEAERALVTNELLDCVKGYDKRIDYCIFTGDLANFATEGEYSLAGIWLEKLYNDINNTELKMIICPGNHDVERAKVKSSILSFRGAAIEEDICQKYISEDIPKLNHFENFMNWHSKFKEQHQWVVSDWHLSVNFITEVFEEINLNFTLVNSAILSCDNKDQGNLSIDFKELSKAMLLNQNRTNSINILAMHHPIGKGWFNEWTETKLDEALKSKNGCDLMFTGHVHNVESENNSSNIGQNITSFSAGAAYAGSRWAHGFSILEIDYIKKEVMPNNYIYSKTSGDWTLDGSKSKKHHVTIPDLKLVESPSKKKR
jgi:predicted MPP superfamily phosphohydrolase